MTAPSAANSQGILDILPGTPTARALPAETLSKLMRDPLLRSTGVLSALFHRAAVICEGDSDCAFYQELNERLRRQAEARAEDGPSPGSYIRDAVFINAHGKHSVHRIVSALRGCGVPAAAVVDLDLLVDKKVVPTLLEAQGADDSVYKAQGQARGDLYQLFEKLAPPKSKSAKALLKRGGIDNLDDQKHKQSLRFFLGNLAQFGIFAPERGEVENWLPELSAGPGKDGWLAAMFERMGMDGDPDYLEPADNDVWAFVRGIAEWIENKLANPDVH